MKIAIFTDTYPPFINGVSTSTYNLAQVLKAHGHDVIVVTPRSDKGKLEYKDGVVRVPGFELKKMYGMLFTNPLIPSISSAHSKERTIIPARSTTFVTE